jgi:hypothetical protein
LAARTVTGQQRIAQFLSGPLAARIVTGQPLRAAAPHLRRFTHADRATHQ